MHDWILIFVFLGFVQVVKGEGMPLFGSTSSKGDLFVEYTVVLPVNLTPDTRRSEFRSIFSPGYQNPLHNSVPTLTDLALFLSLRTRCSF